MYLNITQGMAKQSKVKQSKVMQKMRDKRSGHSIFKNCLDYEWKVNYNKTLIPLLKNNVLPYAQFL